MNVRLPALALAVICCAVSQGHAEGDPKPKDAAAVAACARKHADDVDEAERRCVFALVAEPCTRKPGGQTTFGTAECYRAEQQIWDAMLNENFRALRDDLDEQQKVKLREMQRAWIAYRDTTCAFYHDKIQGTMATGMAAACMARETARRALLLRFLQGL
jgi:uncharacterized protein YecT (DUF1311 family)